MFISFEGPEGGGKSTQAELLATALRREGYSVVVTHEPGGTTVGEAIRQLLLAPDALTAMSARAEVLLFTAARAQLVDEVIRPALDDGSLVLCDRFSDSTIAYQVGGRGLPEDVVTEIVQFATGGLKPDLTFLLDLDVATGLARKRGVPSDRMEMEDASFHRRVRSTYQKLARREPERIVVLDASRPVQLLATMIQQRVELHIHQRGRGATEGSSRRTGRLT